MESTTEHDKVSPASSARRRLVRGVFAAPAAVALHSGSAFAAASNLRCVVNQAQTPQYPRFEAAADAYLRVQLYALYETVPGSTILGWYLSGNTVEAARFDRPRKISNLVLSPSRWQQVLLDDATGHASLVGAVLDAPPGTASNTLEFGPRYVALRVVPQEQGASVDIVGLVDGQTSGTAVTGTCWMSFAVKAV